MSRQTPATTWPRETGFVRFGSSFTIRYPPIPGIEKANNEGTALKLPGDNLSRTGYRLPTEAEWEFAYRIDATTSSYYGSSEELLPLYALYIRNRNDRILPVGQKWPNDFGLFDMHGTTSGSNARKAM